MRVRLATRRSRLALAQTQLVVEHLQAHRPGLSCEVLELSTTGDRQLSWSLEHSGGKGLFTTELEEALRRGEADLAVHSAKDLPTQLPEDLALAGFLPREDPRDMLVLHTCLDQPKTLASGSPRRRAQLRLRFPAASWQPLRGNVETRLRKIASGEAEGTVLAAAGLARLGITSFPDLRFTALSVADCVPAAGQGAVAIQCRTGDVAQWAEGLHRATAAAVHLERQVLAALGGGCQSASAVHVPEGGARLLVFHERFGRRDIALESAYTLPHVESIERWLEEARP